MRTARFGQLLLVVGGAVGVAAVLGIVVGFEPAKLPAALLNIAVYKLAFAAAGGLLAAGAVVRRYGQREAREGARDTDPAVLAESRREALGGGAPPDRPPARPDERAQRVGRSR